MAPELAQMPGYRLPEEGKAMQQALGLAFLVEILALTALFYSIHHQHPVQATLPPMQIALVTPEPPAKPVTPPTPTAKPKVEETPKPVLRKMTPKPHPQPTPTPPQPIKEMLPPSPLPSPVAAPPAQETPTPPPPSPSPVDPAVREDYLSQVKGAIQAAVHFPGVARMLGETSRVLVRFHLLHGHVSQIDILKKGAMGAFDEAALAAVRNAQIPPPPATLAGKDFQLTVWVEFQLENG
ncbi:energy transducer TonB [Acidithiobacillus sulfuriphilus]|uniref:TonB family protein n=2 Tax=Acidithiobacillus sulfuriphilus TaxID=1867749 RepID=A0ACD5HPQ3_9PROT|nr:energy transducer TonB [Acidithiobacillus sulfuriphilus]